MPQHILEKRMDNLEKTVAGLAALPAQMRDLSSQFLQLRQDVRTDISALDLRVDGIAGDVREMRGEIREVRGEVGELRGEVGELRGEVGELRGEVGGLRGEVGAQHGELHAVRNELHAVRDELRADMAAMHTELAGAILANGVEMRTLHEDLVTRITLLGEAIRD